MLGGPIWMPGHPVARRDEIAREAPGIGLLDQLEKRLEFFYSADRDAGSDSLEKLRLDDRIVWPSRS